MLREADRVQRIVENNAFEERVQLMNYTLIGEKHRSVTFRRRNSLLDGTYNSKIWQKEVPDLYHKAVMRFSEVALQILQNRILAALLNEFWCDYLDYSTYLREGIHLTQIGGKNPAEEYNIACEEYYESAAASIPERMAEKLEDVLKCDRLEDYVLDRPTRTYTYLLNDIGEEFKKRPFLMGILSDDYETTAKAAFDGGSEAAEDDDDDNFDEPQDTEKSEKKGFFGKLFGKKK